MNYHRNCSASGMFVFNNIPSVMEYNRRCHCFVLSAIVLYVEALGVCAVYQNQLPSEVFYVIFYLLFSLFM